MTIYPQTFESKTGFDRIRSMLSEGCLCELGRELVNNMAFMTSFDEIEYQMKLTAEMKTILTFEENFPQDNYTDARSNLSKLRIEGSTPEINDLVQIRLSLTALIALQHFFKPQAMKEKYSLLAAEVGNIEVFPQINAEIDRIIDKNNLIKDTASNELREIRVQIRQKQNEVTRKLQVVLRQAKADGLAEEDAEITFRDNRPVIPVSVANKRKLGGMIHDESATGKTAFVEPAAVVELNNKVRELQIAEDREIKRILRAFADFVRPSIEAITASYYFLALVDFTRAKARMAETIGAVLPILHNKPEFNWRNARHPLLYLSHRREKKEIVPLSIHLNNENRILVISGPNAGGKSVCLKTVGLVQYMLQCGLLVPMGENSECGIFDSIFIDIGDEQSIDNDLSTYSGHLENMKFFVRRADNKTLVLIDEFGTGTEPALGGAIAEAVLEKLLTEGAFGVITTHYANLKHFASQTPGIINGAMLFDSQSIKPLYQLSIGRPGSSFALDIARKIGLPEDILSHASEKIGSEHFNYDKQLREIARDKGYWETKRMKIRKVEKNLDDLYEKYNTELEALQNERKQILKDAKAEGQRILNEANARIERAIREIREAQADKEKTKSVRESIEQFKKQFEMNTNEDANLGKKQRELEQAGKNLVKYSPELSQAKVNAKKKQEKLSIQPGNMVRLKGVETSGELIKLEGKLATIAFGNMISTVEIDRIELSTEQTKHRVSKGVKIEQSITGRKLNFKPDIDVRGQRAHEALINIQQFFDEAIMSNAHFVTILHGKGNGILRQLIREYLATLNIVKTFTDAHADRGGAGITEVKLEY